MHSEVASKIENIDYLQELNFAQNLQTTERDRMELVQGDHTLRVHVVHVDLGRVVQLHHRGVHLVAGHVAVDATGAASLLQSHVRFLIDDCHHSCFINTQMQMRAKIIAN